MSICKRTFAWMYHNLLGSKDRPDMGDPFVCNILAPLLSKAQGKVLEIGAGDGNNLTLYPHDIYLTLLEPNQYLSNYLKESVARHKILYSGIVQAYAENIPFPKDSFDTIVATHVLCSVQDQRQVLSEIGRALRPGGSFIFVEHVAAQTGTAIHQLQRLIEPLWHVIGDGCHLTKNTGLLIQSAGFTQVEITSTTDTGFPAIVSPHVYGIAQN